MADYMGWWVADLKRSDLNRIMSQVKLGIVQGNNPQQLVRRVMGGAGVRGTNGVTEMTRQNVASITRTAVNFYANKARAITTEVNSDIFSEEIFIATLDNRTTPVCRANDGKRYPIGEGPIPPLHMGCRSIRAAVIDGQVIGSRPMKGGTESQVLKEFAEKNDLGRIRDREDLPHGTKGKFDEFSRKRLRELTGVVPATETYQTFLEKQPTAYQNEVLGTTKAKLFRQGGLTLDRFVDRQGNELTLAQLARSDRQAFINAGLDPKNF